MRTTSRTPRTRFLLAVAAVATMAATAGCAGSGSDSRTTSREDAAVAAETPGTADDGAGSNALSDGGALDDSALEANASAPADQSAKEAEVDGPAVISTGTVSLEDKDVGKARLEVRKIVDQFRGTVTEQETTTGDEGEVTTARLVLRVPSARFADVTAALEEVGTLTGSTSAGEDVSTEVVDVEARIRAQRKSVTRIEALLARADSLEQIVTIESQLSARQAELDALLARQTYLEDQTSQSTITVYVQQPDEDEADEADDETADGFLGGLRDGWDSFVTGFGVVLTVVGFAIPWLVLLLLVGIPTRLLLRRRGRATA